MEDPEYYIYFFINSTDEKNQIISSATETNFKAKDLCNKDIELYIFQSYYLSKEFDKYRELININQKVNFIFSFDKDINIENTLYKITHLMKYLKENNKFHLKDLINYINQKLFVEGDKNYYYLKKILYSLDELELFKLFFNNVNIGKVISFFTKEEENSTLFFEYINYYIKNSLEKMNDSEKIDWFFKYIFKNKEIFKRKLDYPLYLIINSLDNEQLEYLPLDIEEYYVENIYFDSLKSIFKKIDSFKKMYYSLKFFNFKNISYNFLCKDIIKKINELNDNQQIYIQKSIEYIKFIFQTSKNIFEINLILLYFLFVKKDFDLKLFFDIFQNLTDEQVIKLNQILNDYPPKLIPNIEQYIISNIDLYSNKKEEMVYFNENFDSDNKLTIDEGYLIEYYNRFNEEKDNFNKQIYNDYINDYINDHTHYSYKYLHDEFEKNIYGVNEKNNKKDEISFYEEIINIVKKININKKDKGNRVLKFSINDIIKFLFDKTDTNNNIFYIIKKVLDIKIFHFENLMDNTHCLICKILIKILCNPKYLNVYIKNYEIISNKLKILFFGQNLFINIFEENKNKFFEIALILDFCENFDQRFIIKIEKIIPNDIWKIILFYFHLNPFKKKQYSLFYRYAKFYYEKSEIIDRKDYEFLISLIKRCYPFYKIKEFPYNKKEDINIDSFLEFPESLRNHENKLNIKILLEQLENLEILESQKIEIDEHFYFTRKNIAILLHFIFVNVTFLVDEISIYSGIDSLHTILTRIVISKIISNLNLYKIIPENENQIFCYLESRKNTPFLLSEVLIIPLSLKKSIYKIIKCYNEKIISLIKERNYDNQIAQCVNGRINYIITNLSNLKNVISLDDIIILFIEEYETLIRKLKIIFPSGKAKLSGIFNDSLKEFFNEFMFKCQIKNSLYIWEILNKIFKLPIFIKDGNDVLFKLFNIISEFLLVSEFRLEQKEIKISQFNYENKKDIFKKKMEILNTQESKQLLMSLILILKNGLILNIDKKIESFFEPDELLSKEFDILKYYFKYYQMIINMENLSDFFSVCESELKKDLEKLKFCFENDIPSEFILDISKKLEKFKILYLKQIEHFSELIEIYNLIKDSTKDNIQDIFLFEEIEESDKIIENLILIKKLYNQTKIKLVKKSLEEIFTEIKTILINNYHSKILEDLFNQKDIIKDLFYKQYNQENYIFFQSKKIMKECKISIDNNLKCIIEMKKKNINFEDVIELKDSAKLILKEKKNKTKDLADVANKDNFEIEIEKTKKYKRNEKSKKELEIEKSKEEIEIIKTFIEVIENVQKLINLIKDIIYQGLNLKFNLNIFIKNYKEINYSFSNENEKKNDNINRIYELYDYFMDIKNTQEKYEEEILLNEEVSRLIYGSHFSEIYKYLKDKKNNYICFLIRYLEIKKVPNNLEGKIIENISLELTNKLDFMNLRENIKNIYKFANEFLKENNVNINNILNNTYVKDNKRGIYIYSYQEINYEDFIINSFLNETKIFPNNKNVLIWNKHTTKSQLLSFMYLSLFCKKNYLFLLIIKEKISKEIFSFFMEKIEEMKEKIENMKSCLIILLTKIDNEFLRGIRNIEHKIYNYIENKEIIKKIIHEMDVVNYISDFSGLGKSELIKNEYAQILENENMKYIYFPISGTINEKEIIDRLITLEDDNIYFHIDLIEINDVSREIIREFLFSLIILKIYFYQYKLFCYQSSKFKIRIELNSKNLEDFPFLKYFNNVEIKEPNYEIYRFDSKIAKIFKCLDENNNNPKFILANAEKLGNLSQDEMITLFKKYFIDKKKTFYEIENFSKILNLNIEYYKSLVSNIPLLKSLNYHIIISLISMSIDISKNYYGKFIEKEINKGKDLGEKNLMYEEYSNIKSLIIFNEDKASLSIIPKEKIDNVQMEKSIIKIIKNIDKFYNPIDYNNINQEQILIQIRNFLNSNKTYNLLISIKRLYSKLECIKIKNVRTIFSKNFEDTLKSLVKKETLENNLDKNGIKAKFQELKKNMEDNIFNIAFKEELINKIQDCINKNELYEINNTILNYKYNNEVDPKKMLEKYFKEINQILFVDIFNSIIHYEYKEELIDFLNLFDALKYYAFTYDNYSKYIKIMMKLRVDIPVILMGETGIGKTALIKVLINSLPFKKKLIIKTIHNGINNKELEKFILDNKFYEESNNEHEEQEIIYILFDEINCCNSMGLLSEMMIKHSFLGKKLKKNIKFLGTCNPIKKISSDKLTYGLVNPNYKKEYEYKVNKLPDCLLNFVFDFGCLKTEDEIKYIEQIAQKIISNLKNPIEQFKLKGIYELIKQSIQFSQIFFRNTFDRTVVSLRDLRRYNIFFEFYYNLIINKKIKYEKTGIENEDEIIAVLLTLYICYYIRIRDDTYKNKYLEQIKDIFFHFWDKNIKELYSEIITNFCVNFEKSKLVGIALNRIMKQNLFCLFSCILNKVPIFICGVPGCSKSSSFNILESHMKNEANQYFNDFPIINKISYQGSEISTSEGIMRIYNKVIRSIESDEKIRENEKKQLREKLFLFYFDEMGLADISPHDPLKVIHSILEFDKDYDEYRIKFPFVGISNWILDSSKMNRGIYLNVPKLNVDDLNETFSEIIKSFDEKRILDEHLNILKILSKTYYIFTEKEQYNHFFGLRDFYNLMKTIALKYKKNIINKKENKNYIWEIILESIEQNFGGKDSSVNEFKNDLFEICKKEIKIEENIIKKEYMDIKKRVIENIDCTDYRNLLIIYDDMSLCNYIIKYILEEKNRKYEFYLGSLFKGDISDETQISLTISEIGINLKEGKVIIFQNMDSIYPSLYDLFNQSYAEKNNKLYTKISFGYSNDVLYEVNKDSRCIILVEAEKLENISFPLLNRFEKQIISLNNLLNEDEIEQGKKIYKNLISLITYEIYKKKPNISLKSEIINLNEEEINGLIYQLKHNGEKLTYENTRDYIYQKYANILTQDVIVFSNYSQLKNNDDYKIIINYYIEKHNKFKNLNIFLKEMHFNNNNNANINENEKDYYIHKIIITFYPSFKSICKFKFTVKNEYIDEIFSQNSIFIIEIDEINSQKELFSRINAYLNNNNKNLCIIRFNQIHHLQFVQMGIENLMRKKHYNHKHFIFIVHIKREIEELKNDNSKSLISFLSNWELYFIDDLYSNKGLITDIINYSHKELLDFYFKEKGQYLDKKKLIRIFNTFNYNYKIGIEYFKENNFDNNIEPIIEKILKNEWFLTKLNQLLYNNFKENGLFSIFFEGNIIEENDFYSMFFYYMNNKIESYYIKIFSKIQNDQMLIPLIDIQEEEYLDLLNDYIQSINIQNEKVGKDYGDNQVNLFDYKLKFPNFLLYSKKIISYIERKENVFNNLEEMEEENDFIKEKLILINDIEKYFVDILGNYKKYVEKENIQKIIIEDFCKYYIYNNLNSIYTENMYYSLYILNFFIEQGIKFFCKEYSGLQKIIETFVLIKRKPFIQIISILSNTFEQSKMKKIFKFIEKEINYSKTVFDSNLDGEPFSQIFDLLFKYLCENSCVEINNDNYESFFFFIENIEKIKNIIIFSTSYMLEFKNILLIYDANKNKDAIEKFLEIRKYESFKKRYEQQFLLVKEIVINNKNNELIIEFLFNKLREDIDNELTFDILSNITQENNVELILMSKKVLNLILNKTIFNRSNDINTLIKTINTSIIRDENYIIKLNDSLNNKETNIEESLRIVLLNCFDNKFYSHFKILSENVNDIEEVYLEELINNLDILNSNNKYTKIGNIILISYLKVFVEFFMKLKDKFELNFWNTDKYKTDIKRKSKMEKTIEIYMNKINLKIHGNNINELIKTYNNANSFIYYLLFNDKILFNKEKIPQYIDIIKIIGSSNDDMNDIIKYFDIFFDIFLSFYANIDIENKFSNNINLIFNKILNLIKFNEIEKKFYENNFRDIIKKNPIINEDITTYIIKICSLFLKENYYEKMKNKEDIPFFKFIYNYINYLTKRSEINLQSLEYEGNKLIENIKDKDSFFLNIISKIENSASFSNFMEDFEKNSKDYEIQTSGFEQGLNDFKIEIEKMFLLDEIEPEQFEDKFINFRYFIYSDYPSIEGLKKNNILENYTFINFYIENINKSSLNPIKINNFESKILDYYNNIKFISKKYSKQKIKEIESDLVEFKDDYKQFKKHWNKLYANFQIDDEKSLECILNTDDKTNTFGNNISKYYKEKIEIHNKYISLFIKSIKENKIPKYWESFLSEKKAIQNTFLEYNFFSFDKERIQVEKFNNLDEILYINSTPGVIYKENKFYYKNYKIINYNLPIIDKLLQQSFLIGKSYFKDEQIFIEYNEFDPINKNIFTDYNKIFKQKKLDESIKKNIRELLHKNQNQMESEEEKKNVLIYIKKLMKLIKSNNLFNKEKDNIIRPELFNKQFDEIPTLLFDIFDLEIKNESIVDLYEFIELSIIYDKFSKKNLNDNELQKIILKDETVSILRKFYLRFISSNDNQINKEALLSELILENKDLFLRIPNNQEEKEEKVENKNIDIDISINKIKEDIKNNLNSFTINECLKIYLNKKSQDKELVKYEKYSNIGAKNKENDGEPNIQSGENNNNAGANNSNPNPTPTGRRRRGNN